MAFAGTFCGFDAAAGVCAKQNPFGLSGDV
jgi:hypothetical protein